MKKFYYFILSLINSETVYTYFEYTILDGDKGWKNTHGFYYGRCKGFLENNKHRTNCTNGEYVGIVPRGFH